MKKLLFGGILALALSGVMTAANINYQATVLGAFDGGAFGCSETLLGLNYTCDSFNVTSDAGGIIAVGGLGGTLGSLNLVAPGSGTDDYTGHTLTLQITWTQPGTVNPSPDTFTATLGGQVQSNLNGVTVNWGIGGIHLYSDPPNAGFTFGPNGISVNANSGAQAISGQGQDLAPSDTPEPATMSLLGGALVGFAALLRRRKA